MASKNLCLKIGVTFMEEGSAACIALRATKYKPDKKYLSSLVQQQK
jgi:hypothetical protein